ncbi:glycosyl hydrolase 2 galactose-binding domain-containing protein [Sorangium sp. So ce1128]
MPITSRLASEHVAASYPVAPLAWEVGFTRDPSIPPAEFVPAKVPGAVQLDWARAKGLPDYTVGSNFRQFRFAEDVYWVYRARLELPQVGKGERMYFYCGGVDYRFQVYLQGELCHDQEGMFTPFEIDLTGRARPGDEISVVIFPAPKATPSPEDRTQARLSNKPPVSYGWDWHPRLIPCGIWQETGVQRRPARHFREVDFRYRLSDDLTTADLDVRIETSNPGAGAASTAYRLLDPEGKEVVSSERPVELGLPRDLPRDHR